MPNTQSSSVERPSTFLTRFDNPNGGDFPVALLEGENGGFVLAGFAQSDDSPGDDVFVAKLNNNGIYSWAKTLGRLYDVYGIYDEKIYGIEKTSDGGFVLVGYTDSYDG
jgi:hypothetical protein